MTAIRDDASLAAVLREIEATLIARVPAKVRELRMADPAYALILCYVDTTTDQYTPYGIVAPETARQRALAQHAHDASCWIWSPHRSSARRTS